MSEKDMIKYGGIGGGILVLGLMAYMFKSKADTVLGENITYGSAIDVLRNPDKYKSDARDSGDKDEEYHDVPSGSIEESNEPDDEFDSNEESSIYKNVDLKFGGTRKHNKKTSRKHNKKTKSKTTRKRSKKSNKNKNKKLTKNAH